MGLATVRLVSKRVDRTEASSCRAGPGAPAVMVRGGAPFLSPIDSKLLVEWLDASIPVDVILTA